MFMISVLVLGGVVVLAYVYGVRKQRAWGAPLILVCVVAVITLMILRVASGGRTREMLGAAAQGEQRMVEGERTQAMALLGPLKAQLPPGVVDIFVLGPSAPERNRDWEEGWRRAFSELFGEGGWAYAGYWGPAFGTDAEAVSAAMEQQVSDLATIDLVVVIGGMPDNPSALSIYGLPKQPIVAVILRAGQPTDGARTWLSDGLVDIVAIEEQGKVTTYTKQHLP